jgi:chromosomal replication initiator protein
VTDAGQSDAQLLWDDVLNILRDEFVPPQTIAMLESLSPVELTDDTLIVSTQASFVKRKVEKMTEPIEAAIRSVAFDEIAFACEVRRPDGRVVVHRETRETEPGVFVMQPNAPKPAPVEEDDVFEPDPVPDPEPATPVVEGPSCEVGFDGRATAMTAAQYKAWLKARRAGAESRTASGRPSFSASEAARTGNAPAKNPLVEDITPNDAKLTFETFVEGNENRFALQAAKQVANGMSGQYNPLFIHGGSGLGKTHLLKAIQNYIALNDPERVCVYRVADDFVTDYVTAMRGDAGVKEALTTNYKSVDVLIIDDIQNLTDRVQSIEFFFNTFNHLISHGKQIVIAADVKPSELGMPERLSSRIASGFEVSVQTPEYEFKRVLVQTFYDRMKDEGLAEYQGVLAPDDLVYMAGKAGGNIRSIKAFCQQCLMRATDAQRRGGTFGHNEIAAIAKERWPVEGRIVTIEEIQQVVEKNYGINHGDLIGNKRSKEFMEPRHVAIWMSRELTDSTLAEIGDHFGGRSHGTIKHSIAWVEDRREDRVFYDRMVRMKERLEE